MMDGLKKYFFFPLLSIILFLLLAESILRLAGLDPHPPGLDFTVNRAPDYPEVFLKDHDLFWRLRPDHKSHPGNRAGGPPPVEVG